MLGGVMPEMILPTTGTSGSPPAAPTNVVAAQASLTRVNTTWTDNATDETGYEAEKRTNGGPWVTLNSSLPADSTDVSDLGVSERESVQHRIRAVNAFGQSSWVESNTVCVNATPSAPTLNAQAGPDQVTQINLSWSAPTGTWDDTEVQRSPGGAGTFSTVTTVAATGTTYTDAPGGAPGTTYDYRVRGINDCGAQGAWSNVSSWTLQYGVITASPSVTLDPISPNQITANWSAVPNATLYQIQWDTDPLFGTPSSHTTSSLTYTFSGAVDTKYYVRVRGENPSSNGPFSAPVNDDTWPARPRNFGSTQDLARCFDAVYDLDWERGTCDDTVVIQYQATPGDPWVDIVGSPTNGTQTTIQHDFTAQSGLQQAPLKYRARWSSQVTWIEATNSYDCLI